MSIFIPGCDALAIAFGRQKDVRVLKDVTGLEFFMMRSLACWLYQAKAGGDLTTKTFPELTYHGNAAWEELKRDGREEAVQLRQRDIISNEIYRDSLRQIFYNGTKTAVLMDDIRSPFARGLLKDHLHHRPKFEKTNVMRSNRLTTVDSALDAIAASSAAPPLSTLSSAQRADGTVAPAMAAATVPAEPKPPAPAATVLREYGNVTWVALDANESKHFWREFSFPWSPPY